MGIIIKIFLFLISLLLTSCSVKNKNIGLVLYNNEDIFIKSLSDEIVKNIDEYYITIFDSGSSQLQQNEIVAKLFNEEIDLLIINPVDRLSSYIFTHKSKNEGIPIIFFNREPLKDDLEVAENLYYVGANASQSAIIQSEIVSNIFGNTPHNLNNNDRNRDNKIQLAILKGEEGHNDSEIRTNKIITYLQSMGFKIELLSIKTANWDRSQGFRAMKEIIEEYPYVEIIISNNDAMALGAIDYLKSINYYENKNYILPIVGVDGVKEAINEIENGYLFGTVMNDYEVMAIAISELSRHILGELPKENLSFEITDEKYIWVPYKKYIKDES